MARTAKKKARVFVGNREFNQVMDFNKIENFFESFRRTQNDLAKANLLLQRCKEEQSTSSDIENNLRLQLTHALDRNIVLQRELNGFKPLTDNVQKQNDLLKSQEENIRELQKVVGELKSAVGIKISKISLEVELADEVKHLKGRIQEHEDKNNLISIEHQVILSEKEKRIKQLDEMVENLTVELAETKNEYGIMKNELEGVHLTYNKQNLAYEATIRQYERERNEILGTSDAPPLPCQKKTPSSSLAVPQTNAWGNKDGPVTWADSARKAKSNNTITTYHQSKAPSSNDGPQPKRATFRTKAQPPQAAIVKPVVIASSAGPPPLDITFGRSDEPQQPKKKKLYSSNSNHFIF